MANPTSNFGWQMPTSTDLVTDLPADFEVFGQAVDTTLVDLKGGTSGQILAKNSNTDMDFVWIANDQGDITGVTASSPLTGGGTSGAITVGIQDATTSVKGAVQLSDSTSTTSSILAATPTAVKSAYDLATTASTNANNITMVQQYTATESVLKNVPSRIPAAEQLLKQAVYWIDAAQSDNSDQVLDNQGWGAPALTTQLGSSASADSNDPKFLDFDGTNYVYTTGASTNYLTTPDAAALDISGDIDIRARVAMDDWTPSAEQKFVSKASPSLSYQFAITSAGTLSFYASTTGSSWAVAVASSVATGIADGAIKWVRATLDVDNGASGNDVKFWTSDDGITWTQLGTTRTQAGVISLFDSTSELRIGESLVGKVYRAQILNGIDGTKVLDVDTSVIGSGSATSFSALTGQTVTINRSTSGKKTAVVTHPVWLFGTDDYMEVADNALLDFTASESFTMFIVGRQWATPPSAAQWLSKSKADAAPYDGFFIAQDGTSSTVKIAGLDSSTVEAVRTVSTTFGALSNIAGVWNRSGNTLTGYLNGTATATTSISAVGAISNTNVMRIGARGDASPGRYNDFEVIAAAVFRRALTAAEITTLTNYYTARVGA